MTDAELLCALRKLNLPKQKVDSLNILWLLRNIFINNVVPEEVRKELLRRARQAA
jgi:hypothetical protein